MRDERSIDLLMITYRRPHYAQLSLRHLLENVDESVRVWLWHNGDDEETLDVVRKELSHARVHEFHHSEQNVGLREPTNWLWEQSNGAYVSKVDDDCLLEPGWFDRLRAMHERASYLGAIAAWRFQPEDYLPELANRKMQDVGDGHRVLRNCWVQGSGYLMKRACVDQLGTLSDDQSFTHYCFELARQGWMNGFAVPFIREDHMDDPRSPNSALRSDSDLERFAPIGALQDGVTEVEVWQERVRRNAFAVQYATYDPRWHAGWRSAVRRRVARAEYLRWGPRMRANAGMRGSVESAIEQT